MRYTAVFFSMKYKATGLEAGGKKSLYLMRESCLLYLTYLQTAVNGINFFTKTSGRLALVESF